MKKTAGILLLLIFTGLLYLSDYDFITTSPNSMLASKDYLDGILKSEYNKVDRRANYNIEVEFNSASKSVSVKEEIIWTNKTNSPTSEIQFHLYANAYKSDKTIFAKAYPINSETKTQIDIKTFRVNSELKELIYFQPEILNQRDSTVAKVKMDKPLNPGDSAKIYFEYEMKIPLSIKRMGAASGRNFFFVSQWFPKVGVFENGKWVCSQYHPYLNFYSDYGDYSVKIKVPKNYIVAATGIEKEKALDSQSTIFHFTQSGVHDFVWLTSDNILHQKDFYQRKDGSKIVIQAYIQPEREKYFKRYFETVKNCLKYLENNVGQYPYQNITLVDVPRTSASGGMEYPTLFTVSAELFSPISTGWPEYLVAHEFTHQFFYGLLASNEVYEAWLDEGFTSYFATKIMYEYYPEIHENFKFASYLPIFGLNFLSYNEIPLIYTLADVQLPEGARSLATYYRNLTIGSLADSSYKLPTRLSYIVNSYSKPELVLLTLEHYLGKKKMMYIMRDYFNKFEYKHPTGKDFIATVQKNYSEDMNWFWNEFYYTSHSFDYRVTSINKSGEAEYEVLVERLSDGIFKNEVALYTDKDTLYQKWDGTDRWKILRFNTKNEVIAAEVDPFRKNLLDINIANNSFTVDERFGASLSLSVRWFFWIQNALMILGSIG